MINITNSSSPFVESQITDGPRRSKTGILASIQALRAFAAFAVLLFHIQILKIGFVGVDIFFIISGYIMGTVGINENFPIFLKKELFA